MVNYFKFFKKAQLPRGKVFICFAKTKVMIIMVKAGPRLLWDKLGMVVCREGRPCSGLLWK